MTPKQDQPADDRNRFLKRSEIFESLNASQLRTVLERGVIQSYPRPDGTLFQVGDPADALYVVKAGVVEICRVRAGGEAPAVVAYFGEGDTIGEMAISTGSPRGSLARVPQKAEVFKLSKTAFEALMREIPGLASNLLNIMSGRLEDRLRKRRLAGRSQQLSGDLQYFDLATVIQALAGAGRSGTLAIYSSSGELFASVYFDRGRIRYASLGMLKGKQAVYQIFLSPTQESFIFRGGPVPAEFTDEEKIVVSTAGLLMESVHLQDELQDLKTGLFDDQRQFEIIMPSLAWDDPENMALARLIYDCLQQKDTIAQMVQRIPYNEASIYMVFSEMLKKGIIA